MNTKNLLIASKNWT